MFLFRFLFRLYNLYLSPERDFARKVRRLTGFVPSRLSLFRLAFAHKSGSGTRETGLGGQTNNERLEYLGDAVLGTIVAEYLFKKYPDADEGFLTKMRSKIVKRKSLNLIGDRMGLNVFLQEQNKTRLSSSMLGNAVEALVGAVYLERGYDGTRVFIVRHVLKVYVDMEELETTDDNYKSQLLEACQKQGKSITYKLLNKYKQDRRDRFQVGVIIAGEQVSTADDYNKKAAEQLASLKALETLGFLERAEATAGKKLRKARIVQTSDEGESASQSRPSERSAGGRQDRRGSGASRRGAEASDATPDTASDYVASDEVAYRLVEADAGTPTDAKRDKVATKRKSKRQNDKSRNDRGSYHVRHGIRTAVAAAGVLDAFFGEINPAPPAEPARSTNFGAGDRHPATKTSKGKAAPTAGVPPASAKTSATKSRRRTPLEFQVRHAARTASAAAVVLDGFHGDVISGVATGTKGFAEAEPTPPKAPSTKEASRPTDVAQKPARPRRRPKPRPLSDHALRKIIRDVTAGVATVEVLPGERPARVESAAQFPRERPAGATPTL